MGHKTHIMYIEYKGADLGGPARIGHSKQPFLNAAHDKRWLAVLMSLMRDSLRLLLKMYLPAVASSVSLVRMPRTL